MNTQPDTSTLEGKIAVMQAALEGKRIQYRQYNSDWSSTAAKGACWSWHNTNYRIHPDDLNPPPAKKWRAWRYGENPPVGSLLRSSIEPRITLLVVTSMVDGFYTILDGQVRWSDLKTAFSDREISYDGGKTWQSCGIYE